MELCIVKLAVIGCLLCLANGQSSSTQQLNSGQEMTGQIMRGLYQTIRNIALPSTPLTNDKGMSTRFLLLSPGKVLNYFDYYPGQEYTNFIQVCKKLAS